MNEQRKAERVSLDCPIDQLVLIPPNVSGHREEQFVVARALNISAEGLAGASKTAIDPLMHVFLILQVPTGPRIQCDAYVAHSRMEGGTCLFGLHFLDMETGMKDALVLYIQKVERRAE